MYLTLPPFLFHTNFHQTPWQGRRLRHPPQTKTQAHPTSLHRRSALFPPRRRPRRHPPRGLFFPRRDARRDTPDRPIFTTDSAPKSAPESASSIDGVCVWAACECRVRVWVAAVLRAGLQAAA